MSEPIAWLLINVRTGKPDTSKAFAKEATARAGALRQSNQWRQFVATPVFLYPEEKT